MITTTDIGPLDLLYGAADQLLRITQGTLSLHTLSDFVDSVHWTEPFVVGLLLMQGCLAFTVYFTRRQQNVQFSIMAVLTVLSYFAEGFNQLGRKYWSSFATQNYFDSDGLFMLIFVIGPFLIFANFIVVCFSNELTPSIFFVACISNNTTFYM